MEALGCGCLLGLLLLPLAPFVAIAIATFKAREKAAIYAVDIARLSEADRIRWQAFAQKVEQPGGLTVEDMQTVQTWPTKQP